MRTHRLAFSGLAGILFLGLALPRAGRAHPPPHADEARSKQEQAVGSASISEPQKLPPIEVPYLVTPPTIDGKLDDAEWNMPPLSLTEWLTYNPSYGEKMPQRTTVWMAYDKNYLYFAFRCLDPEPDKIKTSLARRDTIWNDDWVGLSLDALSAGQSAYDLFVNPSGIQGDILRTSTQGEDSAPDYVWDSAGRITSEGYEVEMRVPLKSIRFKSGADVRMGVVFWRRVSRLGVSASWPDLPRGTSIFTRYAPLHFKDLKQPLMLEAIPNVTYSLRQDRATRDQWGKADSKPDAGITVKYGITSSVTLDGTFRPDFSQVESDSFQVEVNQRYPVFYSEKRPFFMEGMGTFELAGAGGDGNIRTAVHTRRIVDPLFGMKLTGNLGRFTFATLSASDRAPGELDSSDPNSGERKNFNIGRMLYSLGKGSYVGSLFTDTEFGGGHNRVLASDVSLHIGEHQNWSATVIGSETVPLDSDIGRKGMAAQMSYGFASKRYEASAQFEHYDRDFNMDTGFYNRTGITGGWVYSGINLYPDDARFKWIKRINPFVFVRGYRDRIQLGKDRIVVAAVRAFFTRQGTLQVNLVRGHEPWARQTFNIRSLDIMGQAQLLRWLNVQSNLSFAHSIFYDEANPFLGRERAGSFSLTIQPNSRLNQGISFTRDEFNRLAGGGRVYTVNIVNTRTGYQISRRFSVRAIAQYDSSRARILTDFLGSYELVPGTVAYAGYGSIFERRSWDGQQLVQGPGDYLNTQRGLFFKVSYLHRF
jgi:hypothetical protein